MNAQRFQAYLEYQKILAASKHAAYDSFDRAVLTLSTAMLGLSMSFIKNVVDTLRWPVLLYGSWVLFFLAIAFTLFSFIESQRSMDLQQKYADEYYVNEEESAISRANIHSDRVRRMNVCSGSAFGSGLLFTVVFVIANLIMSR